MSAETLPFAQKPTTNPFELAKRELIASLTKLPVPRAIASQMPYPDDFETVSQHIRQAAELFDAWLGAIGHEVAQNASCRVNKRLFDGGVFLEAVVGWATAECDRAAIVLANDHEEMGIAS